MTVQLSKEDFVSKVVEHMVDEHKCDASAFADLRSKIADAYQEEGRSIAPDELIAMAHGEMDDVGTIKTPGDLEERFPQLAKVFTLAYSYAPDEEDGEGDEDDEDDDDEDEEGEEGGESGED